MARLTLPTQDRLVWAQEWYGDPPAYTFHSIANGITQFENSTNQPSILVIRVLGLP